MEAATVAWHHMGWTPVGFSEIEPFPSQILKHHYPTIPTMATSQNSKNGQSNAEQSTFWSEELPAKHSVSQDSAKDSTIHEEILHSHFLHWLTTYGLNTSSGKMSPVCCRRAEDGILVVSSGRWSNSGMGSLTESWTLNSSEGQEQCLNGVGESSLSRVLETGELPQKFYLSPKACQGILRRATKRGKALPPMLEQALRQAAKE